MVKILILHPALHRVDFRVDFPVDTLLPVWQDAGRISPMQNQISLTRGAAMKERCGKRQFPISKAHIARRIP
jgi:hypothetical protein